MDKVENERNRPLLIGVSSRSLFDMELDSKIFKRDGLTAYRRRQRRLVSTPFKRGIAFTFVERMLSLNDVETEKHDAPLVEVGILSHMDPDTGIRVMNSIKYWKLPIRMTIFTSGESLAKYVQALGVRLYLSMDEDAIREAVDLGLPAGHILPSRITQHDTNDGEIRLAFDFDGVIGDDSSEKVFQEGGLDAFNKHESRNENRPISPGPLAPFIRSLAVIQYAEKKRADLDDDYRKKLRISVITSRGNPANVRVMKTLDSWGIALDSAFFMNGHDKSTILNALHPHLFFDDQLRHLDHVDYGVHIPFGDLNRASRKNASVKRAGKAVRRRKRKSSKQTIMKTAVGSGVLNASSTDNAGKAQSSITSLPERK
jgi:5'-nucleotidase